MSNMRKIYLDTYSRGNGWDESHYSLVFDEEAAELYIERSWHNWSPSGIDKGSENITLATLKRSREGIYQKAVQLIAAILPEEESES